MRLALIAPPVTTVAPAALGGLAMVSGLAEGLAARGHHVTLIGSGLNGLVPAGYAVADTGLDGCVPAEYADDAHAELAGPVLDQLSVDLVSDHSRAGYLPGSAGSKLACKTLYGVHSGWSQPGYVGLIPVSHHQYHQLGANVSAPHAWLRVIHPAIPLADYPLSERHDGPLAYVGPLHPGDRAELAIQAAHEVGLPLVLAGSRATPEAHVHAEVRLRPMLTSQDVLLDPACAADRRLLLSSARCVITALSDTTTFPLDAIEAMAYGTPVVGLAGTAATEVVINGISGMIAQRSTDLAQAIRVASKLDPAAVRASAERFDIPRMVTAYEALFDRLIGGRR
jgi:glycosyltransferase involved in cell wall biosynthesis